MKRIQQIEFHAEDAGYHMLRIPCIIAPQKNVILCVFEARHDSSDWAWMDLILFASYDGGSHFDRQVLVHAEKGQTVNNPVLIDGGNGTVHFLYCVQYGVTELSGGVFYAKSTDYGRTFSAPRDITSATLPAYRNAFATGPMHGIMSSDGTLFVPVWLVPKSAGRELRSHHPAELCLLVSSDGGEHWYLTDRAPDGEAGDANETCAAELANGNILLNIRSGIARCRCFSVYDRKTDTFSPIRRSEIPDPICCGSMVRHGEVLYLCGCEHETKRQNLTLRKSADSGATWEKLLTVTEGEAGYSDISVTEDGRLLVLYETNGERTEVLCLYE